MVRSASSAHLNVRSVHGCRNPRSTSAVSSAATHASAPLSSAAPGSPAPVQRLLARCRRSARRCRPACARPARPGSARRSPRRTRTRSAGCRRGSPRPARRRRRGAGQLLADHRAAPPRPARARRSAPRSPAFRAAASARSSSVSMISACQRGRRDRRAAALDASGISASGRPSPLMPVLRPAVRTRRGRAVVAHPVALGAQVPQVLRVGAHRQRHPADDRAARSPPGRRAWPGCW